MIPGLVLPASVAPHEAAKLLVVVADEADCAAWKSTVFWMKFVSLKAVGGPKLSVAFIAGDRVLPELVLQLIVALGIPAELT